MKKRIVISFIIGILILSGCTSNNAVIPEPLPTSESIGFTEPTPEPTPKPTLETLPEPEDTDDIVIPAGESVLIDIPSGKVVGIPSNNTLTVDVNGFPDVEDGFGLYGATVRLENVYAGWSGSAPLTIVNGKDYARTFHLMIQQPGTTLQEGYEPFPEEYFSWITIEDITPKVAIGGTRKIAVTLAVPYEMPPELKGNKYDVRILVEDWSQTGFIQLALQEKWLVEFWDGVEIAE